MKINFSHKVTVKNIKFSHPRQASNRDFMIVMDHSFRMSAFFRGEGSKICQICQQIAVKKLPVYVTWLVCMFVLYLGENSTGLYS